MKTFKRFVALLLTFVMTLSYAPVALAETHDGISADGVYYVASASEGGSDRSGDGTEDSPFLTVDKALEQAESDGCDAAEIDLLSDISFTGELEMSGSVSTVIFAGNNNTISYDGAAPIGGDAGLITVENCEVFFDNVTLKNATALNARLLSVGDGGKVYLENTTVTKGTAIVTDYSEGGAGALVLDNGYLYVGINSEFISNSTTGSGGAILVQDGGNLEIAENAEFTKNSAAYGGAIYIASMSSDGFVSIKDSASISGNKADYLGGGVYICKGANAAIEGEVTISGNTVSSDANNVYLADGTNGLGATLDISNATSNANISITAENPYPYKLVSLPYNEYEIKPTSAGDEAGWSYDDGSYCIRYMTYNGVEGLYLYYKTVDLSVSGVDTLTGVDGTDINGEDAKFMDENGDSEIPGAINDGTTLTVPDVVPIGAEEEFVISISCDPDEYRIPDADVLEVTSDGSPVDFEYEFDVENGTGKIIIRPDVINGLTGTLEINAKAEKYYDLTLTMEGPLFSAKSTVTGIDDSEYTVSQDNHTYTVADGDGSPVEGVIVTAYNAQTRELLSTKTADVNGEVNFDEFSGISYYLVLTYSVPYRVVSRDKISLELSTLPAQELSENFAKEPDSADVTYDAAEGKAVISGIEEATTVTFRIQGNEDTIIFVGNEGAASTAPADLEYESKSMDKSAAEYGELPDAELVGYTFLGWFDAAEGGNLITATTLYDSINSAKTLYAHWEANKDTEYTIKHWVEYAEGGVNARKDADTETTSVDGVTYYLYESVSHSDGISDSAIDISELDLKEMTDDEYTWWTREGFTASFDTDCTVLADGSSVFNIYYERNRYTVHIDEDSLSKGSAESDEELDDIEVPFGGAIGTLPEPELPGYDFDGFFTEPDGEGDRVDEDYILTVPDDVDIYADWTASDSCYTIIVVLQDIADNAPADTWTQFKSVVVDNDDITLTAITDSVKSFAVSELDSLAIEGFNYAGYSDKLMTENPDFTADTENAQITVAAGDASVVYLYYARDTKVVEFPDPDNDGEDLAPDAEISYGGTFELPEDPTKPGHDFDGWEDENGNPVDEDTPTDDYITDGDEAIILVPTWEPRDYVITYVPGTNATFVPSSGKEASVVPSVEGGYTDGSVVTYGEMVGVMPSARKDGYKFEEWRIDLDDPSSVVKAKTIVSIDNIIIKNDANSYEDVRPLYAYFVPHTYHIQFDAGVSSVTGDAGTVDPTSIDITFDEAISNAPIASLTGYTFHHWVVKDKDGMVIAYLEPDAEGNTAIYWIITDTTGNINVVEGDVWNYASQNGTTFYAYAVYVPNEYNYTFDLNDSEGSTKATLVDTSIDFVTETFDKVYEGVFEVEAERPGYTFEGWSLTPDGEPLTGDEIVAIPNDSTVYAIWAPKSYDVTFVMNGSDIGSWTYDGMEYDEERDSYTISVVFDTTVGELAAPAKDGAEFIGWLVDAPAWTELDGTVITSLPQYIDYGDEEGITLIAKFDYVIHFDPDGGTFEDDSTDPKDIPQSDLSDDGKLPDVEKDDYEFEGWIDKDDPSDEPLTLEEILESEEPMDLIPIYSAYITFDANGGRIDDEETAKYSVQTLAELLQTPAENRKLPTATRSAYTFKGWYTEKTGGEKIEIEALVEAGTPCTVYAQWSYNGGGSTTPPPDEDIEIYPPEPEDNEDQDPGTPSDNGGTTTTDDSATPGDTVYVTTEPDPGYKVDEYSVVDEEGNEIPTTPTEDGFSFEMPNSKVVVTVIYTPIISEYLIFDDHIQYIFGYPNDEVGPDDDMTRAEAAQMFYNLLIDKDYGTISVSFDDVSDDAWYAKAVNVLASRGIIYGYDDGTFGPERSISRAEFVAMCVRFIGIYEKESEMTFPDVSSDMWCFDYIRSAVAYRWISGYTDGLFRPNYSISRAQVVTIMNNILLRNADESYVLEHIDELNSFSDLTNTSAWYYYDMVEATNAHEHTGRASSEVWIELN